MNPHHKPMPPAPIFWPPLLRGTLIERYKRFLADVRLEDGRTVTAHCANSGRMTSCCQPGRPVYLSHHDLPRRKLKYTWQIIDMPTSLVGINTQLPNRLVAAAISAGQIGPLAGYRRVRREVAVGNRTRIDLMLEADGRRPCYVEVKNCTLVENQVARFPDAVTLRGRRHLQELTRLAAEGNRCAMFYLVQRSDARAFAPADPIDPDYGRELRRSAGRGVEILAWDVALNSEWIAVRSPLTCRLDGPEAV